MSEPFIHISGDLKTRGPLLTVSIPARYVGAKCVPGGL